MANIFRTEFKGLPPLYVVQSVQEAPASLRSVIRKEGAEDDVAGAWHNGDIYLFADHLRSLEHAVWVMLHESTHYGLRGMFGNALGPVLMDIYYRNRDIRAQAEQRKIKDRKLSTVRAVEETLADMGADGVPQTIMQRLIAAVRRLLRRWGVKLQVTDEDVRDLVARALLFVKTKPSKTHLLSGTVLHPKFSRTSASVGERSIDELTAKRGIRARAERAIARFDALLDPLGQLP